MCQCMQIVLRRSW